LIYLDSSALVKLVVPEPESAVLFDFLAARPERVSSALARVEVLRALKRAGFSRKVLERGAKVLDAVALIRVDDAILDDAARLEPTTLRSLDAIHLATARVVGEDLEAIVTYDGRLGDAARELGLRAVSPA
jgi:uncharacterized protein